MNKKEDRRIRKTKKQLCDALATLLQQKQLKNITVSEITCLADVNRGTFYLHYRDIYDMLDQIQRDILERFNEIITTHTPQPNDDAFYTMLTEIFRLLKDNANFAKCLVTKGGDTSFAESLKNIIKQQCYSGTYGNPKVKDSAEFLYFVRFAVSGCMGICEGWLEEGMKEYPEEIAKMTEQMILNGFYSVK